MTSDAKIGLLLGLAFIFVIAFIINGLPRLRSDTNNNELTNGMLDYPNNPPGLAAKERRAHREIVRQIEPVKKQSSNEVGTPQESVQDIRFTMPLPRDTSIMEEAKKTVKIGPTAMSPSPSVIERSEVKRTEFIKPAVPKTYVVREGDNLAVIAKKFYGPQEGNRIANITRIFQANRKLLKSPDEIYVGQKLTIPPLSVSKADKSKETNVFSNTGFTQVESIGKRHLSTESQKVKQAGWYVVREGDSLWRIAAQQLGDGSRYIQIAKLNADILEDEDYLTVGMRLKVPAR
jgi:nucleoid-associated protein YgaU